MGLLLTAIGLAAGICGFVILVARGLRRVPWLSSGTAGVTFSRMLSRRRRLLQFLPRYRGDFS